MKKWPSDIKTLREVILGTGVIPEAWKTALPILIPKPNKKNAFPLMCLLNLVANEVQTITYRRLETELELEDKGGLSGTQYGLRQGRSTLMAIQEVV